MFVLITALIGAGLGYAYATQAAPSSGLAMPVGLGALGGVIGGALLKLILPLILALLGAAAGAALLLYIYRSQGPHLRG